MIYRMLKLFFFKTLVLIQLVVSTSCIREDVDGCQQYNITVTIADADGNDITSSGVVSAVDLYLFDESGFVRMVPQGSSSDFFFGEEKSKTMMLVGWGNLNADSLKIPQLTVGTSLEDARIELLQRVDGNELPCNDLFYCKSALSGATTRSMDEESVVLQLKRLSSAVSVRTSSFAEYFHITEMDSCKIVVRSIGSSLNFLANLVGDTVNYEPEVIKKPKGDFYVSPFRVFPTKSGENLIISIYRSQELLFKTATDDDGDSLYAPAGSVLNVSIDFANARIKVTVDVTPWKDAGQNTEL
jgi:hypothetical protein